MANLTGKTALVTGASRGIGAAIALRLAREGADVAFTYAASTQRANELVLQIEAIGAKAQAIQADAASAEAVKEAVKAVVDKFGKIDILVNNAGIIDITPIEDFSDEAFERILSVNVRGVFTATRESVRHMGQGGRVIMIGSVNSDSVPFAGASVYALTKGAIAAFTRGLARDLGPRGITVNNVQPGPVDTEANPENGPFGTTLKGYMATGRYAKVEEIAGLVAYLASPEAASITGAGLKIDGGFDA